MEKRALNGSTSSIRSLSSNASTDGDSVFIVPAPAGSVVSESLGDTLAVQRKLERKLLCRRSVNELAEQGIYPPLKSPAAFHEQTKHLERAKTGDILKHKIEHRPDRLLLVAQNILDESAVRTGLDPAIQARQRQLKKARLRGDLNDRLARRPGPFDLVQTNILEPDEEVRERIQQALDEGGEPIFEDEEQDELELVTAASTQPADTASNATDDSDTLFVPPGAFGDCHTFEFDAIQGTSQLHALCATGEVLPRAAQSSFQQRTPSIGDRERKPAGLSQSHSSSSISPTASVSSSITVTSAQSTASLQKQTSAVAVNKKSAGANGGTRAAKPSSLVNTPSGASRTASKQRVNLKFHLYTGPPTKRTERSKTNSGSASQPRPVSSANLFMTPQSSSSPQQPAVCTPDALTPTDSGSPTHSAVNISTAALASYNFQRNLEQQTVLLQLQNEAERTRRPCAAAEEDRRLLERLDELKVTDLRVELRRRGQRTQGTKPELSDRLRSVLMTTRIPSQPAAVAEQSVTVSSLDSPSGTISLNASLNASNGIGVVVNKAEGPNANVEALMQQLQQEIEYEHVKTRMQETNARLAQAAAASQPSCYVLSSNQPVIFVNLPGTASTQTTTCSLTQPPTLALATQSSLESTFSSQNGLFSDASLNGSLHNGVHQLAFSTHSNVSVTQTQSHSTSSIAQLHRSTSAQSAVCGVQIAPSNSIRQSSMASVPKRDVQQLNVRGGHTDHSAQVDDILEILIRDGDLSPSAARTPKDAISSPSTVNILSAIAKRRNPQNANASTAHAQHVVLATAGGHGNDSSDVCAETQAAASRFRFSLPPSSNGMQASQENEAMEYTPAPSPVPAVVNMDDCSLFSGCNPHSQAHNSLQSAMMDESAAAEFTEQFGDELLSLMNASSLSAANGLSNAPGLCMPHLIEQANLVQPVGVTWNGPDSDPFQLGAAHMMPSWYCGSSNGDIDLNSLMYASGGNTVAFARVIPSENAASPQSACDTLRCDR